MSTTDEHKPSIIHHLGYRIVIGWSTKDKCYKAWIHEWKEDIIQPCACGDNYVKVAKEAKDVLELFVKAINDEENTNE